MSWTGGDKFTVGSLGRGDRSRGGMGYNAEHLVELVRQGGFHGNRERKSWEFPPNGRWDDRRGSTCIQPTDAPIRNSSIVQKRKASKVLVKSSFFRTVHRSYTWSGILLAVPHQVQPPSWREHQPNILLTDEAVGNTLSVQLFLRLND